MVIGKAENLVTYYCLGSPTLEIAANPYLATVLEEEGEECHLVCGPAVGRGKSETRK